MASWKTYFSPLVALLLLTDFRFHSGFRKKCPQARLRLKLVVVLIIDYKTAHQSYRISEQSPTQARLLWPTFSLISKTRESRMRAPCFHLSSSSSAINPLLFVTFSLAIIYPTNLARDSPVTARLHIALKTCSMYQDASPSILLLMRLMNVPKRLGFRHHVRR